MQEESSGPVQVPSKTRRLFFNKDESKQLMDGTGPQDVTKSKTSAASLEDDLDVSASAEVKKTNVVSQGTAGSDAGEYTTGVSTEPTDTLERKDYTAQLFETPKLTPLRRTLPTPDEIDNKEDYSKQTTLTGTKLHYNTPVLGFKEEDKELKRPSNQLQKSCLRKYPRHIMNVFKKVTGKKGCWSVWISRHLYVDFNLTLDKEDIQVGIIQGFFIGEGMPPCLVTLYDSQNIMSANEKMQEFTGTVAQELDSALHNFCYVDFVILPITISWNRWSKDTLEREIQKQQDHMEEFFFKGPLEFTTSDFQKVEAAANALTGVSYVPYILSKNQEQEDAEFSEQDYLILMERQWRHSLSLMIEALSFEDGDCSITYTEENEKKAKMAALEAARRWSLSTNVIFVFDDLYNKEIEEQQNDLSSAVETNLQTEMHLTMQTPMEPRDESAKFIFLDCDDVTVPREIPVLQEWAAYGESIASTGTAKSVSFVDGKRSDQGSCINSVTPIKQPKAKSHGSSRKSECSFKDLTDTAVQAQEDDVNQPQKTDEVPEEVAGSVLQSKDDDTRDHVRREDGSLPRSSHQTNSFHWRQIVSSFYPDALTRTYTVPPVNFNRVPYVRDTVPGTRHSALVLYPPSDSAPGHNVPAASQGAATSSIQLGSGKPTPGHQKKGKGQQGRQPAHSRQDPYTRSVQWQELFSGQATHGQQSTAGQSSRSQQRAQYSLWTPESVPPCTPVKVKQTDISDDFAQNHVMVNLQELGNSRQEAMFILSRISFGNYLNQPAYAAAAAQLPRPSDLDTQQTKYSDGEADFLLIHRQHGILIGELKTVGKWQGEVNNPQPPADADVAKRVTKAVKQLDRSETVVRHLVSDAAPGLSVRKTLFLPYMTTEQLRRILDNDPQLEQVLCQSLGATNTMEAVLLCCCSDQLSQPASYWHVTPAVLSQLSTWWQHRMAFTVDTLLTDDTYLDIVARFVGPATTVSVPSYNGVRVEVRTAGQAVAELGWRLVLLVLTLQQLDLLNRNPQLVCITGPPGTGKTVMLVLQGLRWLLQGHDVQVVSGSYYSRAVSGMVAGQLGMALSADPIPPRTPGSIDLHHYDFTNREADVQQAVTDLLERVKDGQLFVLIDEVDFDSRSVTAQRFRTLVARLTESVPGLHLWCACLFHSDIPPCLQPEPLTVPLRSAPSVLREVQPAVGMCPGIVHNYSDSGVPAPGDGLRVVRLSHHGNAHTGRWPVDCRQCGKDVATVLRRLGVGSGGSSLPNSPTPLSYRDVIILTRSSELHDDIMDDAGRVTSPATGVVRGLRDEGLPVCVLGQRDWVHNMARWERDVDDIAVAATDRVTVAHSKIVQGLERRVVVILPGRGYDDEGMSDDQIHLQDRLHAASRCTTQLIMVDACLL